MTNNNSPYKNIFTAAGFVLLFAIAGVFLILDKTVSQRGQTIEILGAILGLSAFFGKKRLQVWENAIQESLDIKARIVQMKKVFLIIVEKLEPYLGIAIQWLLFPLWIYATWYTQFSPNSPTAKLGIPLPIRILEAINMGNDLYCTVFLIICLFPFLGWKTGIHILKAFIAWLSKFLASGIAALLSPLLFIALYLVGLSVYTITIVLLIPYYLSATLSNKLSMRPTMGVFAAILVIIGSVLQKIG